MLFMQMSKQEMKLLPKMEMRTLWCIW